MPGLAPFELRVGRQLSMKGVRYEISHVERRGPLVTLRLVEPPNTKHKISRDALANVIVCAEAVFVDEPDEPEPAPDREVTNIVTLTPYRALDWFALMFLLIRLNAVAGSGPKSMQFRRAYYEAVKELHEWAESIGYTGIKVWSPFTLYRTLRRWRVSRYASSAVSRKGLEPAPWSRRPALYVAAEKIATAIVMKNHTISTSNLLAQTNDTLIPAADSTGSARRRTRIRTHSVEPTASSSTEHAAPPPAQTHP